MLGGRGGMRHVVGGGAGAKRLDERMNVRRGRVAAESERRNERESALRLSLRRSM
jgi:hypothetical protein